MAAAATISSFAAQFAELEAENTRLRKELEDFGSTESRVNDATKLAEQAWEENENLKRKLAEAEAKLEEASKLREQEQKTADVSAKRLSKAIESLLGELAGSYLCSPFSSRV